MNDSHFALSDDEIRSFADDGVVRLKSVIDHESIEALKSGINELMSVLNASATGYDVSSVASQAFDHIAASGGGDASQYDIDALTQAIRKSGTRRLVDSLPSTLTKRGRFKLDTTTWRRSAAVRQLALDSMLPEIAAGLLDTERVNYLDDQVFVKEPGTAERTAFHQDYTYFHVTGWKGCVMWICVDPANEESGAPVYVRGSHRWGKEFRANVFLSQMGFPGSLGEDLTPIEDHPEAYEMVRFDTMPGDVIVHHFRTVHGAGGNRSLRSRRALSLRYCGDDIRYFERPGAPVQPYHHHELENGNRLDSEQFPVVWPRPFPGFSLAPVLEERHGLGRNIHG